MHVLVWQFLVDEPRRPAFEAAYGPAGPWAELFGRTEGFLGLELLADPQRPRRYLTLDHWRSAADAAAFQERFGEAYRALDAELEGLPREETRIGAFDTAG